MSFINTISKEKISCFLLICIAFFLPFYQTLLPIFIILLFLLWLLDKKIKEKFILFISNYYAKIFVGFYLLHIVGLFYSTNINYGLADLESKISLLVFPLLLSSSLVNIDYRKIIKAFILGCFIASVFCLLRAIYIYLTSGQMKFFYTDFTVFHPSYLALYINFSLLVILVWLVKEELPKKERLFGQLLVILFTLMILLLSSKMGIISMGVIYTSLFFYIIFAQKRIKKALLYLFSFLTVFYLIFNLFGNYQRFSTAQTVIEENNFSENTSGNKVVSDKETTESTAVRMLIWNEALLLFKHNFVLGVGTGDVKDALLNSYQKAGMTGAFDKKLNAHSQFFQTLVAFGLIGLILFLSCFLFPFIYCIKTDNFIYAVFLVILFLNFAVESMLERQAGTIFYSLMNSLLLFFPNQTPNNHLKSN